ncbi:MAG: ion transporter [Synechococcus sp.]
MTTPDMTWQQRLALAFDPFDGAIGRWINIGLALLVVVFCAIYVVGTYPISSPVRAWLDMADTAILVVFSFEYGLRWLAAPSKSTFVLNWYSAIDLLSILPLWLGIFDIRVVKFVRLLKGFRVLRLARYFQTDRRETNPIRADKIIIARIIFTLFTIVFVYAGLIYEIEHASNPTTFRTFLDAFYFSVVTMTTVGYGDVTPVSDGGRLLTVLMILTGIALVPWQVGDLIKRLVRSQASIEIPCSHCGLAFHEADSMFCRRCGTRLKDIAEL